MALPIGRNRTAAAPARGAAKPSTSLRGEEGRNRSLVEQQRTAERAANRANGVDSRAPFRFRVQVGETRSFIVLDNAPDFFRYEHAFKDDSGKWGREFHPCIAEFDDCPACRVSGSPGYYAMYFSVIDLTPYTDKNGEEVPFSRKLAVVKPAQHKKFLRAYTRLMEKYGTMRGAVFETSRDSQTDASIGNDINLLDDEPYSEEELAEFVRYWTDKENKEHEELCYECYNYDELFPSVTREELARSVGAAPTPGSDAYNRQATPPSRRAGAPAAPSPSRTPPARRGRAEEEAEDDTAGAEEDWEDAATPEPPPRERASAAPRRTVGREAPAAATKPAPARPGVRTPQPPPAPAGIPPRRTVGRR